VGKLAKVAADAGAAAPAKALARTLKSKAKGLSLPEFAQEAVDAL